MRKRLEQFYLAMHADIIEIILNAEEVASLLDEIDFLECHLLIYDKDNILICLRRIVEPSSDLVGASMNARVVKLRVSWVSEINLCEECRLKQVSNAF